MVPVASKALAISERQVVNHAGCEVVVEIDLGERPVQLAPIGQGIVGSPDRTSNAIGEAIVISTGVGVANQGVEAMTRVLGLRLNLQRIVMSAALVGDVGDRGERKIRKLRRLGEERAARTAAKCVTSGSLRAAGAGVRRGDVEVVAVNEDVRTPSARIADGKNDITGNLVLDINVELLDLPRPEIDVLRLNGSREGRGVRL